MSYQNPTCQEILLKNMKDINNLKVSIEHDTAFLTNFGYDTLERKVYNAIHNLLCDMSDKLDELQNNITNFVPENKYPNQEED